MTETDRTPWHTLAHARIAETLETDPDSGLSVSEAADRLRSHGPNVLEAAEKTPAWRMFVAQFNDFMIWVLMAAVVISAVEGQTPEAVAIAAILLLNGVLGFVQEYRAEQALEALKNMAAPAATVLRDGIETDVAATDLVPGDVVLLESGDKIPADGRLVRAAALKHEEASLTGESRPVSKTTDDLDDPDLTLGDRTNMAFAGTSVAVGRGTMIVTETGQRTQMGLIADLLAAQEDERSPLQAELRAVGKRLALLILAIAAVVFFVGGWQAWQDIGGPLGDAFANDSFRESITVALLVAISLAVAAIPEGLPAIVTVSLSLGVRRMAEQNAIVRKLHAVETLGSTTFICSDKTGTLTRNEMTARRLLVGRDLVAIDSDWALEATEREPDASDLGLLLEIASAANDAHYTADGQLVGDPTETALIVAAEQLAPEAAHPERIGEVPFDSDRKRMTTVHATGDSRVAYMKGGADVVLGLCSTALLHGETVPMTDDLRAELSSANESLAGGGFRTLAFATRTLDASEPSEGEQLERDLTYVGIVGLVDPPRPEVSRAIDVTHAAGMEVAMITGDHALTARAIGEEIGLLHGERVVTGAELERITDEELFELVEDIRIYARVNPEHKLRIVDALKRRGHVVAMTGDGVNDAPALKKADIGVAMGMVGTDVSREAADMVLTDDNFATIVSAIHQGRVVFDNLRKFILFLLSCNASEVLIIFLTTFVARTPALLPLQILWMNLVTDGLPALALGVDPAAPDVMERPPRGADEGILTRRRQAQVLWQGAFITAGGLLAYWWGHGLTPDMTTARAQTILFTVMVAAQLLHSFNFRSQTRTVWSRESLKNRWLLLAAAGSIVLQLLVIYTPFLQRVFRTEALHSADWLMVLVCALLPVAAIDLVKVSMAKRNASR
jgi:Ca2+-transporting ATPase